LQQLGNKRLVILGVIMELAHIALWAFPVFIFAGLVEAWIITKRQHHVYHWRESAASLGIAVGQRLINVLAGLGGSVLFLMLWEHRWWTMPTTAWWYIPALFLATEFAYYWHHRVSHESRWFWATHSVHHSPQHLYLLSAYRLGLTGKITGHFLFYLPLIVIGFHPLSVFMMLAINLAYQFWLHTELIGRLGWFDVLFNSPSNHRVHHATNPRYLDSNYGGMIMLYDHLFATYVAQRADDAPRYGLVTQIASNNPLRIALNEWLAIACDLRTAHSLREVMGYLFAAPGWRPDGHGNTTANLREAASQQRYQHNLAVISSPSTLPSTHAS
jgi:sterol desaturase/sphingolipid hydroxylase (fatty acid hydroxylase superfamily)